MRKFAIEVDSLIKNFGSTIAVDDISFNVEEGTITALLGGNGAGKTTIISMLMGLLIPTSGNIKILGKDIITDRYSILPKTNFSSPYVDLPNRLTVQENLNVYANLYSAKDVKKQIASLSEGLNIKSLLNRKTGQLSAGQKTRVALAKALINDPQLLFLDEPTASLDPDTADWIRSYLQEYAVQKRATILLASHHMGEVERLSNNVFMLQEGKIVDSGTPKELVKRYGRSNMEEVFLDVARGRQIDNIVEN